MAVDHVRSLILNTIEDESLATFNKACATTDKLFQVMERTNDVDKAYAMCLAWCTSVLELAQLESRLLSSVLPQFESELDELVHQITPLIQRREDARMEVHELRGPDHDVRPLSMKTDPKRAKASKDARQYARDVSIEVLGELRPIQENAKELQKDIGRIRLSLRTLQRFTLTKFPIPRSKPRLRGQSAQPTGESPIEVFARNYAANLESRDKVNAQAEALRRARAHPVNRFNAMGERVH